MRRKRSPAVAVTGANSPSLGSRALTPEAVNTGRQCAFSRIATAAMIRFVERVLDAGPIPYRRIALYGDPDLEHGLRHFGLDPQVTSYRLIDLPVAAITDTASMPHRLWDRRIAEAVEAGAELPPLVVFRHPRAREGWGLLDGVSRTNAFVALGVQSARAYELLQS